MAGLGQTVADLARYKRALGEANVAAPARSRTSSGRLLETARFGPNPGGLKMLSYAPAGLTPGAPLVVVLHGCTQTAQAYAGGAGWLELADRHGFVVLCPEQPAGNNPNRCFNWFQAEDTARGGGEAASIHAMVLCSVRDHGCDPARVFVSGLSAGGAMASVMLAAYPEVFAGGAIIAGLPYGAAGTMSEAFSAMFQGRSRSASAWGDLVRAASDHRGRWPKISVWHGGADATVKPMNAEEIVKQWADVHGLSGSGETIPTPAGRHRREWATADGDVKIQLNILDGLSHGTPVASAGPDGCGRPGPFLLEAGVSSSAQTLRFWGLDIGRPASTALAQSGPAHGAATSDAARRPGVRPAPKPASALAGVEQIIAKALTKAGLMK